MKKGPSRAARLVTDASFFCRNLFCVYSSSICKRKLFEEFRAFHADIPVDTLPLSLRLKTDTLQLLCCI